MYSRKDRRKKKLILVLLSCIIFGTGFYFLNVVSRQFEVPLGNTFHVIFGCTLMAISGIYIIYTVRQLFFTKKKTRTKRVFLNEDDIKKYF